MARMSLAVESTLGEELSQLAKKKNMTVYALTNEIIEAGLEVINEGVELDFLKDLWKTYRILKDFDAILLPSEFMDSLLSRLYEKDREFLLSSFYRLGREVGRYLKILADTPEQLFELGHKLLRFYPLKTVNIKNIGPSIYEVNAFGVGGTIESTQCVFELARGIFEEFRLKIIDSEVSKGLIRLKIQHEPNKA
ncbi:MAG: hypothetical protein QXV24_05665 [Nitrososphaerota archaeon]